MELIWQGAVKAAELVLGFDAEVWSITWRSLQVSGYATLLSLLIGIPFGIALALALFTTPGVLHAGRGVHLPGAAALARK